MKLLKRILIVILSVIALLLITALFVKKDYNIERDVVVNKAKNEVFNYVKHARNQDHFNKWILADPQIQKQYRGTDGTVGFVYAWDSKEAGKGAQTITGIREGERVDLAIHFIEPMESDATAWYTTEALDPGQTKIKWGMRGSNPYPLNLMNLFMPALLGKDLQTSLGKLKDVLEKQ